MNERLHFFIGMTLFAVSVCMAWAFVSYLTTGTADQSIIENLREGELANEDGKFQNAIGSLGAYTSYFLMKRCFGLAAFGIPLLLFVISLALMKAYKPSLLKWFMCVSLIVIWLSLALAWFVTPFTSALHFCPGGDHGLYVGHRIVGLIGSPGLFALLVIVAILFLMYLSGETVLFLRNLFNPMGFLKKVKFVVTDPNEEPSEEDSYEKQIQPQDEDLVFDNPETETIDFDHNPKESPKSNETSKPQPSRNPQDSELTVEVGKEEEKADGQDLVPVGEKMLEPYDPKRDLELYKYPTLDLLKVYEDDGKPYIDMEEQTKNKNRIVEVLRNFGIEINSIKATVGPTITLYEIT